MTAAHIGTETYPKTEKSGSKVSDGPRLPQLILLNLGMGDFGKGGPVAQEGLDLVLDVRVSRWSPGVVCGLSRALERRSDFGLGRELQNLCCLC